MKLKTATLSLIAATALAVAVSGCQSSADVASSNLSKAADNFEVSRRIVFYNGITGEYLLVIEGQCSKGNGDSSRQVTITCKVGDGYKKHFMGLSDNMTYIIEQVDSYKAGTAHYRVNFKPSTLIPDIRVQ